MSALAERHAAVNSAGSRNAAGARPWHRITIASDIGAIAAEWRALEAEALVTPYQAHDWIRVFVETVGRAHDMVFRHAVVRDQGGTPLAILPLVITRRNGIRFAGFIGGKHANYHMGIFAPAFAASLDAAHVTQLLQEVAQGIGGLDAFVFVNQPTAWQGMANPMAALAAGPSPSGAYKLALIPGDGDATLKRTMSSHARKKLKNKLARFADFGSGTLLKAQSPEEIARIVDAFLHQKAARFAAMGVPDPFADPAMRLFLERAALPSGRGTAPLELYGLDVGGKMVATYVGAVQGTRFSGMATSFDMGSEMVRTSPGEILLVELIKRKCHEGVAVFDLGVGEARYKTTICDDRDELVDSFLPLTAKGRVFALFSRTKRAAKRWIKSSPTALRLAQRVSGFVNRSRPSEE